MDRIGRESENIKHPAAVTLGLMIQPAVLRTIALRQDFRGRGLLARFLYARPVSRVGHRRIGTPVAQEVEAAYHDTVKDLATGMAGWGGDNRAVLTLVAVVAGAAFLYTMPAFATVTPPTPPPAQILMIDLTSGAVTYTPPTERTAPGFWTALEYSARESISLLQARGMPAIDTTGVGTLLDFLLRLAGPVLLAFAILALRARTKR